MPDGTVMSATPPIRCHLIRVDGEPDGEALLALAGGRAGGQEGGAGFVHPEPAPVFPVRDRNLGQPRRAGRVEDQFLENAGTVAGAGENASASVKRLAKTLLSFTSTSTE